MIIMASYSKLSKAQSSFFNILRIISSIPPSSQISSPNTEQQKQQEVRVTDTNVQSFKVDNNGLADREELVGFEIQHGDTKAINQGGDGNFIDLLIEAAKLVFAEDESNSEEASQGTGALAEAVVKKRKRGWVGVGLSSEMDDTSSPVVRSKRGRTQELPYRFRDSLLEPLNRSGRSSKRHSVFVKHGSTATLNGTASEQK